MRTLQKIPKSPLEDALSRLSLPIGCGYKGHEDVIFGVPPIAAIHKKESVQGFERVVANHFLAAGHKQRKIREIS